MTGQRAVIEARDWLGTPYVHQASCNGAGCDCLGLLRGVWRAVLGVEPEAIPPYSPAWDEVGGRDLLRAAAMRHMAEIRFDAARPGDVLLFRMRRDAVAKHLGLLSVIGARPRFIHAYSGQGVVESALTAPWARRIDGVFRFPDAPHPQPGD